MRLIDLTCPKCGASLQVNEELKSGMCNHCGQTFLVDDEVKKVKFTDTKDAGYEFELGRQAARKDEIERIKGKVKANWEDTILPIIVVIILIIVMGIVIPFVNKKNTEDIRKKLGINDAYRSIEQYDRINK